MPVLCLDLHLSGTLHQAILPREGKTALAGGLTAGGAQDAGVHQLDDAVAHINNDHPAQNAHLGRSQSHTVGLIHGLCHVVQQFDQPLIKFFHRAADFIQRRIVILANFSNCHIVNPFLSVSLYCCCRSDRSYIFYFTTVFPEEKGGCCQTFGAVSPDRGWPALLPAPGHRTVPAPGGSAPASGGHCGI